MSLLLENRNEVGMYNKRRSSLLKAYLLSACTLALGVSRAADAATVPGASSSIKGHGGAGQHGGAGASKGDSTEKVPEVVSVSAGIRSANGVTNTTPGGGMMPHQTAAKSKGGVTRDFIAKQSATASVTSLISQLPGVNVASQGPTNMNQDNIHIRGFDATRIGFLLEGIPLADPISYYSYSAAMVDPENLGSVTVTQGSPDMESPVFNAVGGEVSSTLINPSARAGAYLSVTGGTRALNKEFLRLETGQIGNSGVRGFVSFSHTSSNMWMGPGRTRRYLVNAKFVKEWGDGNSINAIFGFSQQDATYNYMPTQAVWEKYGRSATYNGQYYPGDTAYYKLNARAVNYEYLVAPMNFHIARELRLKFTPYLVRNWGYASAGSSIPYENGYIGNQRYDVLPVNTAQNGKVTAQLGNPYEDRTAAQNIALNWDHGISHLTFGYWYSYTTRSSIYNYSAVSATGEAPNSTGTQPIVVDGRKLVTADSFITQQINTFYLMESLSLLGNRLKVGAGLRASMVHFDALNKVPGASVPRVTPSFFEPLPQVWGSFDIDPHNQIYVNGSTAFKPAAGNFAYLNLYSPSSPTPTQVPNMVPPEYAISEEIGYRHTGFVNFSMALFNNNMTNYQVVSSRYAPNSTYLVSSVIDIGGGDLPWCAGRNRTPAVASSEPLYFGAVSARDDGQ
ncbi:TonB-dependent receptor [Gluconacetobacter liquefaciens]|uniref:TonB-dependent receptor n=1 Tax=Gluconacetobacter liquefaciens TaxID=89584 RepID=UPI00114261DA|nr:TonB-dependent receptor plug domain-containing protein [Gluconacetobacter liquefaciens]